MNVVTQFLLFSSISLIFFTSHKPQYSLNMHDTIELVMYIYVCLNRMIITEIRADRTNKIRDEMEQVVT